MTQFPRYRSIAFVTAISALALAGCSRSNDEAAPDARNTNTQAVDAAAAPTEARSDASAAPGADPSVAPGVAFLYNFSFRLPDDKVSAAQDRHTEACAKLGTAHCRLVDIRFDRQQDGPVNATAQFLVDPALARGFVRDAATAVDALDGETLNSSVKGENVGDSIAASQRQSAAMGGDLRRIEQRLAQPGLSDRERAELQQQAQSIRGELNVQEDSRRTGEARLATTPINFTYTGTTGIAGYDNSRPFASAFEASSGSVKSAAGFVMMLFGVILPWALMLGGVALIFTWFRKRLAKPRAEAK